MECHCPVCVHEGALLQQANQFATDDFLATRKSSRSPPGAPLPRRRSSLLRLDIPAKLFQGSADDVYEIVDPEEFTPVGPMH